jgi:hypothetical protein
MNNSTIERDIEIEAPIEVVWRTITEPELIRTWFADTADVEARPGAVGSLTFRAETDAPNIVGITVVSRIDGYIRPASARRKPTRRSSPSRSSRTATNGPDCASSNPASTSWTWPTTTSRGSSKSTVTVGRSRETACATSSPRDVHRHREPLIR